MSHGLHSNDSRYFDPDLGRYLTPDGCSDEPEVWVYTGQSEHRYPDLQAFLEAVVRSGLAVTPRRYPALPASDRKNALAEPRAKGAARKATELAETGATKARAESAAKKPSAKER